MALVSQAEEIMHGDKCHQCQVSTWEEITSLQVPAATGLPGSPWSPVPAHREAL